MMPNYTIETRRAIMPGFHLVNYRHGGICSRLALDGSKSRSSPRTLAGLAAGGAAAILLYLFHAKNSGARYSACDCSARPRFHWGLLGRFLPGVSAAVCCRCGLGLLHRSGLGFHRFMPVLMMIPMVLGGMGWLDCGAEKWITVLAIVGFWWRPRSDWHWLTCCLCRSRCSAGIISAAGTAFTGNGELGALFFHELP